MKHKIKKLIFIFLKRIKYLFEFIGIEVSLRKKDNKLDPIQHNSLVTANQAYSSKYYQRVVFSKEQQALFYLIIQQLKNSNINLDNKIIADFGCGVGNLLFHINSQFNLSR